MIVTGWNSLYLTERASYDPLMLLDYLCISATGCTIIAL
jgi:hypothetical protein